MSNELTKSSQQKTLRDWLQSEQFGEAVKKASPKHFDEERLLQIAITAMNETPKLQACDQSSFLNCLLILGEHGLRPNGRDAHLIPFEDRKTGKVLCQLIIDYKGYVRLLWKTGVIKGIRSDVVYDGDIFDYRDPQSHVPWEWRKPDNRPEDVGNIRGAYTVVEFTNGGMHREVMTANEIEKIRARSRAGGRGPWVTDFNEMAKKTVFRRAIKWLPIGDDIKEIAEQEDDRIQQIDAPTKKSGPSGLRGLEARLVEETEPEKDSDK